MVKLSRRDLLRRVIITGASFGRNLAYYRVGREPHFAGLLDESHPEVSFWRQANVSFLELAVLDWGKLLGGKDEKHHWEKIVSDRDRFASALLGKLSMSADVYRASCKSILTYRNKFVAHLDYERVMEVPLLDAAKVGVWHYCEHVFNQEGTSGYFNGLPDSIAKFEHGYEFCQKEARSIFYRALGNA